MQDPNWLEMARNGQRSPSRQPTNIPVRADEIVNLALVQQARRRIQHAGQELSL